MFKSTRLPYPVLLIIFATFSIHLLLSASNPGFDDDDDDIQAIASLTFYIQEWKEELTSEKVQREIDFSDQDIALLWDKTLYDLDQSSTNVIGKEQEKTLQEAYQAYQQVKNLIDLGKQAEAIDKLIYTSHLLLAAWEKSCENQTSRLDTCPFSPLCLSISWNFENNSHLPKKVRKETYPYLLPLKHPMKPILDSIFLYTRATTDATTFSEAGFMILSQQPRSFICVAKHPLMPNYLVKAYLDTELKKKGNKSSWKWLVLRCQGAEKIRTIIQRKQIKHFVVPDKWIYCFPQNPSPPKDDAHTRHLALLLVSDMHLVAGKLNYHMWSHHITEEHLNELYMIISRAKGSSYRPDNIAYTNDGKFAFIDTEYPSKGPDYKSIRKYLNKEMCAYWDRIIRNGGF